jgi:uncharacterized protein YodC (DUF2158 family)
MNWSGSSESSPVHMQIWGEVQNYTLKYILLGLILCEWFSRVSHENTTLAHDKLYSGRIVAALVHLRSSPALRNTFTCSQKHLHLRSEMPST